MKIVTYVRFNLGGFLQAGLSGTTRMIDSKGEDIHEIIFFNCQFKNARYYFDENFCDDFFLSFSLDTTGSSRVIFYIIFVTAEVIYFYSLLHQSLMVY